MVDEIVGQMLKNEGNLVINCIWKLCVKDFECGVVLGDRNKEI